MVDIFNEVEEDLRRDRYHRLWRRYGVFVIGAAVAVVVATGGVSLWRQHAAQQREAAGAAFSVAAALDAQGKHADAATAFAALAESGPGGYALLARLRQASAQVAAGDRPGAVATLDAVASAPGDADLRALAGLRAASLVLDANADDAIRRLQPLAAEGQPWRHSAREMLAAAWLLKGDAAAARNSLKQVADDASAPQGARDRAAELLASLGGAPAGPAATPAAP